MNIIINYECDNCHQFNQFDINEKMIIQCKYCEKKYGTINLDWNYNSSCLFCKKNNYYKRKNFNQLIGLFIIILGGFLAISFYSIYGPLSYLFLFVFSVIDFILFRLTKFLGVCYSCSAEYINVKDVDLLPNFKHHQLEIYQK